MDEIVTAMDEDLHGGAREPGLGRRLAVLALLTGACFAAGKIGLVVPIVHQRVTLLWPPAGIALAAVLLGGAWVWPAIALGSLLVSFSTGTPPVAAVVIAAGNTLGALAGGWLLRRVGFRNRLERVRDVLALVAFGVAASPAINAVVGVAALNLAWGVPSARVVQSALSWWLGDAMGVLLVTPVLLTGLARPLRRVRGRRILEAAALGLCLLVAGGLTLSSWNAHPILHPPLAFTLFPFLVWAALRFGPRGAASATFLAVGIAFWATARGLTPFALGTVEERLMYLYSYAAVSVVTSMLLAAIFAERSQAEEGIRQSEERLRLALAAGRCGAWDWDIAGQRLTWSEEVFAIHAIPPESFQGRLEDFTRRIHPEDAERVGAAIQQALEGRGDYQIEFRILRPDGEVRWIQTTGRGVHDASGSPVRMLGAMLDVTDRRRAEDERARLLAAESEARAEAEAASEAKDSFLAALSHELRTPLTPVLAVVSRLEGDERLRAVAGELAMVRRNVELEARLIDDLLDLTRIARGKLELHPEVVDLRRVVEHTIEMCCEPEIAAGRLRVTVDLAGGDLRVWGDPPRLTQILWNLLNNAVKFTPAGGAVTIRSWSAADRLGLEVSDTGVGIDPDALPHIFDAFEQGGARSPHGAGGLGLGLAISRAVADMHGGHLTAASAGRGRGATFTLSLPASLPAGTGELPIPAESCPEIHHPKSAIQNLRILLVEDHADTAEALAELLRLLGHHVTVTGGVAAALAAAAEAERDGGLDLVISDLGLPDGTGHDVMRGLSRFEHLPGIALSGYGMEDDVRRSHDAGFDRHLTKPVSLQALEIAIWQVVRREVPNGG
jgi:PAS domain S-box-containing protein